jgi:hypothetical protein
VSDDLITSGQQALLWFLKDGCTITHTPLVSDGRGGYVPGTPSSITTVANVQRSLSAEEKAIADRLGVVSPAVIRLPVSTAIEPSDTITVGQSTFQVVTPLENTINLTLKVLCKELT